MPRFVLRRLALIVPQLVLVVVGVFLLLRILPADPIAKIVGLNSTKEAYALAKAQLGLDRGLGDQLGTYLGNLFQGDLGTSWNSGTSVASEIGQRFPVTIQLIVLAFLLALAIGIPLGRALATRPGGPLDKTTTGYSLFAGSQPDFWWGLLFIFLLYFKAKIFPAPLGLLSPSLSPPEPHTNFILIDTLLAGDLNAFKDAIWHYALPVLTLAFILSGPIIKMTRESVLTVANSEYILYARAMGVAPRVVRRHMIRTALAPVVTLVGILFGFMLGGAVLTETVFSLDGIGVYALQRVLQLDFPAVQGAVIVMTAFSLLIYLLMDILYAVLDPRVRYSTG